MVRLSPRAGSPYAGKILLKKQGKGVSVVKEREEDECRVSEKWLEREGALIVGGEG